MVLERALRKGTQEAYVSDFSLNFPEEQSHNRTVWSAEPDASRLLSALKWIDQIERLWPEYVAILLLQQWAMYFCDQYLEPKSHSIIFRSSAEKNWAIF